MIFINKTHDLLRENNFTRDFNIKIKIMFFLLDINFLIYVIFTSLHNAKNYIFIKETSKYEV